MKERDRNGFEYNTVVSVLGYVLSHDKKKVLMLYHNANSSDISYGKYNGYSDMLGINESAFEAFKRVVMEQAGLDVKEATFRGSVHWPNFTDRNKSMLGMIFVCDRYEGLPSNINALGQNRWVTLDELLRWDVPVWDGDKKILPLVFDKNPKSFHGYMPYDKGVPRDWFFQRT